MSIFYILSVIILSVSVVNCRPEACLGLGVTTGTPCLNLDRKVCVGFVLFTQILGSRLQVHFCRHRLGIMECLGLFFYYLNKYVNEERYKKKKIFFF